MRLIDAEDILVGWQRTGIEEYDEGKEAGIDLVLAIIDHLPTIETKFVEHAHWISEDEAEELGHLEWSYGCSNCKEIFWDCTESFAFSYCPHCGAQMDGTDTNVGSKGVKIPVISMEDVPKLMEEMEK